MDLRKPLGQLRVAEVRGDDRALSLAADVTGQSIESVKAKLADAHGAALVRNALEPWPWRASALGGKTAALARDAGLHKEIIWLTRTSKTLVTRRLNASNGKKLLRNVFWDSWPSDDAASPPVEASDPSGPLSASDAMLGASVVPADPHDTDVPPVGICPGALVSSRYDLLSVLGSGGFGTSWKAHDRLSGLDIVLKVPHAEDGGAIRRELELAFQVVHPNICQAFPDRDDETGQPFLVMQYGGKDLRMLLEERGWRPFPLALAVHVLTSIADALDYLHERLILHLDVSPMNILLGDDDVVRLTDFGASARARSTPTPEGTHTVLASNVTSLHHFWSAPELFQRIGRSRSDQYSLFLVFATLLSGRMPESANDLPRPPFAVLTDAQNAAVKRALSWDPDARFESCGEAARAVADDMSHVPTEVLASDLDALSHELELRLEREISRFTKTSTARVGGVVMLGRGLERLLQAVLSWQAAADGFDPTIALRTNYTQVSSLTKATAGQIANTILSHKDGPSARSPEIASIVADLDAKKESRIWRMIGVRNAVVHGARPGEAILPAAQAVARLITEHRRIAGWGERWS